MSIAPKPVNRGAELLFRWRCSRQLSQQALSDALALDRSQYAHYERGTKIPGLRHAVTLEVLSQGLVPCGSWLQDLPGYQTPSRIGARRKLHNSTVRATALESESLHTTTSGESQDSTR